MESTDDPGLLGDRIGRAVEDAYQKLSPACKPVTRSNGVKEWTVLAGVIAINHLSIEKELRLISISTGVKALPDVLIQRSQGRLVHDCHAEILAIRGFNTVLLEHINYLSREQCKETDLIEKTPDGNYVMKSKWHLALYTSTIPCGDASMKDLLNSDATASTLTQENLFEKNSEVQWIDQRIKTILRGRFNYDRLGVVRTKPGRYDSQITYSKSCSDKLCLKQLTSVLSCLTWDLLAQPVFLDFLVIPKLKDVQIEELRRSFQGRLGITLQRPLKFLSCSNSFIDGKSSCDEDPGSMSSVKLFVELPEREVVEQAILNGLKNGFHTKGNKPLRKNCEPIVSRLAQWKIYLKIRPEAKRQTYLQLKHSITDRKMLVQEAKGLLSPDGWICTRSDDCQL